MTSSRLTKIKQKQEKVHSSFTVLGNFEIWDGRIVHLNCAALVLGESTS